MKESMGVGDEATGLDWPALDLATAALSNCSPIGCSAAVARVPGTRCEYAVLPLCQLLPVAHPPGAAARARLPPLLLHRTRTNTRTRSALQPHALPHHRRSTSAVSTTAGRMLVVDRALLEARVLQVYLHRHRVCTPVWLSIQVRSTRYCVPGVILFNHSCYEHEYECEGADAALSGKRVGAQPLAVVASSTALVLKASGEW